jgi:predicted HTH domain antitoxin
MNFSAILDISSFFIGMIINLIFVALMCYYFKRKYDYLELAQNEQAKILYQLIHKQTNLSTTTPTMDFSQDPLVNHILSDMEGDSDSDSDSDGEEDEITEITMPENPFKMEDPIMDTKVVELSNTEHLNVEEVKKEDNLDITVNLIEDVNSGTDPDYNKMSIKQLKEILSSKGIKAKTNIKKDELLELITNEVRV